MESGNMKLNFSRDLRHVLRLAVRLAPALVMWGCSSGISGHAPGLAGGQTLDPGTVNYPLAYVKRPIPAEDIDVRDLITSTAGGDLYLRAQASAGGVEANLTAKITQGKGDVRDLDVSPDGKKLLFSLRLPLIPNAKEINQPTWKIYEYDAVAKTTTQLTTDSSTRGHDVGAHYLPDGRIVFSSTRQSRTKAILLDEGRPQYPAQTDDRKQPIFLLHVREKNGDIHQITFNTNHDFAPSILNNGQIVFSRYEVTNGQDQISLYRVNPDGTGLELYYGSNSHATGANIAGTNTNVIQFLNARQQPNGLLLAIARPFLGTQQGGDALRINADPFVEVNQATLAAVGTAGPAQASATLLGITTDANLASLGGRIASAYPLYDGTHRMLLSWSPCLVLDATQKPAATVVCTSGNVSAPQAPPQYTLWIYAFDTNSLTPIIGAQSGLMIVDPILMQARTPAPTNIPDAIYSVNPAKGLLDSNLALLKIRSVYDFDGVDTATPNIASLADPKQTTADQRPDRFIRIEKAVEIPDNTVRKFNASAFGPAGMGMREILAYAPVEPDGSVQIRVPPNVPFTIEILDKNARRVSAPHTSWLQLMPGEIRTCNGCHTAGNKTEASHGRSGLTASVNLGATTTGQPFPNTVASLFANSGELMAETLARITCQVAVNCSEVPSINVLYKDLWTDNVKAGQGPFPNFSYLYADLKTLLPSNPSCAPSWGPVCRSVIHYPLHLQPIWKLVRQTVDPVTSAVTSDHTCVLCHNPVDAANKFQVPAGQLDLTDSASAADPTVTTSYTDLLFPHNQQQLNMGVLQDLLVPGPINPATGKPTLVPVLLAPPMVAGSANESSTFFGIFDGTRPGATVNHIGFLTPAELRLISEWLDIGGQYYNDPFVAPAAN